MFVNKHNNEVRMGHNFNEGDRTLLQHFERYITDEITRRVNECPKIFRNV